MDNNDVPVFSLWQDFTGWLLDHTEKFPRKARFTFAVRIANLALDILEDIIHARYDRNKSDHLHQANAQLNVLRVLVRMSCDRQYLSRNAYEYAVRRIDEAGRMIGGWHKASDETRR